MANYEFYVNISLLFLWWTGYKNLMIGTLIVLSHRKVLIYSPPV